MEYREAQRSDLKEILNLYEQLNPGEAPLSLKDADRIWDEVEQNRYIRYFVAEERGELASTCNICIVPNLTRGGRPYAIIENVVTSSVFRKRGIGRKIMQMAIDFAIKHNCYKVILLSGAARTEAHAFYESLGFSGTAKKGFDLRLDPIL